MKKILVFFLLSIFLAASCKKNSDKTTEDQLPPATQTGANIFACKVSGQNWIAKNYRSNILGYTSNDTLIVSGASPETTSYMEIFFIRIYQLVNGQQRYRLNDTSKMYSEFVTNKNCFPNSGGLGVGKGKSIDGELKSYENR